MLPEAIEHFVQRPFSNEEVRRKIHAAIGDDDALLALVKKRKLRRFRHISRSSGLMQRQFYRAQ